MNQSENNITATVRLFGADIDKVKKEIAELELPEKTGITLRRESHIVYLDITVLDKEALDKTLDAIMKSSLSVHIADDSIQTLEDAAIYFLKEKGLTLALAESCTGGLCAARLVDVSGASQVFLGSVVSYANSAKHNILGVHASTLEKNGAVSGQTVVEMARGARYEFGADIAVSVSGIAGPTGGTDEKPVGTVYVGYSSKNGSLAIKASFGNIGRSEIREKSVNLMLHTIIEHTISRKGRSYTL